MRKVLLLNASEEILKVITWQHAVKLLISGKAQKPHGYEHEYEIKTVSGVFKLPAAIVLMQYVRIPYKAMAVNKENVLRRDDFTCQYCSRQLSMTSATIDHVLPQSRGGSHIWTNVVASCRECNNKKDNFTIKEAHKKYGMKLKSKPFVPSRNFILMTMIENNQSWSRWVEIKGS